MNYETTLVGRWRRINGVKYSFLVHLFTLLIRFHSQTITTCYNELGEDKLCGQSYMESQ